MGGPQRGHAAIQMREQALALHAGERRSAYLVVVRPRRKAQPCRRETAGGKEASTMTNPREQLSADRLCEASNAVVRAIRELMEEGRGEGITARQVRYPPSLMGTWAQPGCLSDFTRFEVEEATCFLIRLGVLETHGVRSR